MWRGGTHRQIGGKKLGVHPPPGLGSRGGPAWSRATRPGVQQLGPVRGHALLPTGTRQVVTRNLWWIGRQRREVATSGFARGPRSLDPGLCQRTSALAVVPDGV